MDRPLLIAASLWISAGAIALGCAPKNYTPVEGIPTLAKLEEVMDVMATSADPQFAKREQPAFSDQEFAAMHETAQKIGAASKRTKDFSKGKDFDALADRLNGEAAALDKAAEAKDAPKTREALSAMKATCKECHSRFR